MYQERLRQKNERKEAEENTHELKLMFDRILKQYKEKIETSTEELNKKMDEISNIADSNIIKNIQIISVFSAIISLLFANVIGVLEFEAIGSIGLLLLNSSVLLSIFALLVFTKILIVDDKLNYKIVIACLTIILVITAYIFLLFSFVKLS